MPQDKRRSISYRSFVTCDNPKGVVECGTIRKSTKVINNNSRKKEQHLQHNLKVVEGDNNNNNKKLAKKKMCLLTEVTRSELLDGGGDKMINHVTNNSSSNKPKIGDDKEIAKDILKGAFDLQESLLILGKLQEETFTSLSMSRLRRKEKGTFDCMVNGVVNEKMNNVGFQRPRKSTDEMKSAVRDCLLRQNMITNPIFEENFDHRRMGGRYNMASTSSSSCQSSSMVRSSSNFVPSDSSSSSVVSQRRKKKDSNLIVRLMGLESPPMSPKWNIQKPALYDVESPKARKYQYSDQIFGKKQRSVDEILESLHFKGLLRSSCMNNVMKRNSVESEAYPLYNRWYDDRPPIVILKPLSYSMKEEETIMPKFSRRKAEEIEDRRLRDQDKLLNEGKITKQKDGRVISKKHNVSEISVKRKKYRQPAFVEENKKGKGKEKEIEVLCKEKTVSTCDEGNKVFPIAKSMVYDSFVDQNLCRNTIKEYNVKASTQHRESEKTSIYEISPADTNAYDDSQSCYSEITSVSASENYSPAYEVTLVTTHENGVPVNNHPTKSPPSSNEPEKTPKTSLHTLLLSNPLFLTNLELFDIQVVDQIPRDDGKDRVLIDYANEFILLKSLELSQTYSPQKWIHTKNTRNLPTLDELLEEIKDDIEGLNCGHDSVKDDTFSSDDLYVILDRDLRLKSSGMWEIGWRKMYSRHEVEGVVREVDKFILGKLIEEVVLDIIVVVV